MDDVFREQSCQKSSAGTKWAYLATDNGVYRFFPARAWNVSCGMVDIYDARIQQWFLQVCYEKPSSSYNFFVLACFSLVVRDDQPW